MFFRPRIRSEVIALFSEPEPSYLFEASETFEELEENICHIFSWAYMNNVMTNLVEQLPTNERDLEEWSRSLQCFVNSICLSMYQQDAEITWQLIDQLGTEYRDNGRYLQIVENFRDESQRIANNLMAAAQDYTSLFSSSRGRSKEDLDSIEEYCHDSSVDLLDVLCSMPTNLKMGDASWNQSIGAAVDPRSWRFSKESCYINSDEFMIWDVPSESERPTITDDLHCELTHPVDCEQIMWAFQIHEKFVQPVTYLYTGIYVNEDEVVMTVCSSSNPFARVNTTVIPCEVPIYAYDRLSQSYELRY